MKIIPIVAVVRATVLRPHKFHPGKREGKASGRSVKWCRATS